MSSELPDDLESLDLLSQASALLSDGDDFDEILSQIPPVESFDQYLTPQSRKLNEITNQKRFRDPVNEKEIKSSQKAAVPKNTVKNTNWSTNVWKDWSKSRWARFPTHPSECPPHLYILASNPDHLNHWMTRFVLEARRLDGKPYPPNTLHQLVCGILRYIRELKPSVDFFKDKEFAGLRCTLDAEMKSLKAQGYGTVSKQAEPLTTEEEEKMWVTGTLGDHTPQSLLDTMVFMCGLYFALRSGQEHRSLRMEQICLVEPPGQASFLVYTENVSKNNPGGLHHRKLSAKKVHHYENKDCPQRCFIRLFKSYTSHRPTGDIKDDAFYLTPIRNPKTNVWYTCTPVGHNTLTNTMKRICGQAGVTGYKTNHSLRVTTATRLFQKGVDEQLIMARTGHRSTDGIRTYKRISDEQHKALSDVLNNPNSPDTTCKAESFVSPSVPKMPKLSAGTDISSGPQIPKLSTGTEKENNFNPSAPIMNFSGCSGNITIQFGHQ